MDQYTIYCTEEQTRKALGLGAPIELLQYNSTVVKTIITPSDLYAVIPTAEQMIGWLEEQHVFVNVTHSLVNRTLCNWEVFLHDSCIAYNKVRLPRKEATLAAIDAALEYLLSKAK